MSGPLTIRSQYGSVETIDLGDAGLSVATRPGISVPVRRLKYVWTPSALLLDDVPAECRITFDVYADESGQRHFIPAGGIRSFENWAWLAGLAIMKQSHQLSTEAMRGYRAMHLVFTMRRRMQAHLKRAFSTAADLTVRPSGRGGGVDATILPESLGLDAAGNGKRWSVTRLLEEGRARARELGLNQCSQAQRIAYGLMVAAERDPLVVDTAQAIALMRISLFACDAGGTALTPEIVEDVQQRLMEAFEAHQHDSPATFERWFGGGKSNLAKSLANQAGAAGGKLKTGIVQAALAELVWQSYQYESGCLNLFAQAFLQALPQPVDPSERSRFAQLYQPQPYLGGLPLALVWERSSLLRPLLVEIWQLPDDQTRWRVLWRVLYYYSEMASLRRRADRESKTKSSNAQSAIAGNQTGERKSGAEVSADS